MVVNTNFFSGNAVQSNQNTGQNISLTERISTMSWDDSADFKMGKVLNIISSVDQLAAIKLAKVEDQQPFQDLIIINRTADEIGIYDQKDDLVAFLPPFNVNNPGENAGYFFSITSNPDDTILWKHLRFNTGDIPASAPALAGSGLVAKKNGEDEVLQQALRSRIVNLATYKISESDLATVLVYNAGNIITSSPIYWTLPSLVDFPAELLKSGFFFYVSNVNSPSSFYIQPSVGDTINGSTTSFNLATKTSTMFVCNVVKGVVHWYTILTNPSPGVSVFPTYFPCQPIPTNSEYLITPADNSKTLICNDHAHLKIDTKKNYPNGFNVNIIKLAPSTSVSTDNSLVLVLSDTSSGELLNGNYFPWVIGPTLSYQLVSDGNNKWFTVGQGDTNGVVESLTIKGPAIQTDNGSTYYYSAKNQPQTIKLHEVGNYVLPSFKFHLSLGHYPGGNDPNNFVFVILECDHSTMLNGVANTSVTVKSWNVMVQMDDQKNWWMI